MVNYIYLISFSVVVFAIISSLTIYLFLNQDCACRYPMSAEKTSSSFQSQVSALENELSKFVLLRVCRPAVLEKHERENVVAQLLRLTSETKLSNIDELLVDQLLMQLRQSAELISHLQQLFTSESRKNQFFEIRIPLNKMYNLCQRLIKAVESFIAKSARVEKNQLSFIFVESQLLYAIRNGHWILFDNINS